MWSFRRAPRALTRHSGRAVGLACVLVLTGCTDDGPEGPDAGPAPRALEEAVATFSHGNTGAYTFQLGDDGEPLIRTTGTFALDEAKLDWRMTLSNGERTTVTEQRRLGGRSWLRTARDADPTGCWRAMPAARAQQRTGTPFEPPRTASGQHPVLPQAAVVTTADDAAWVEEGTVLTATTDLHSLAATLGEVVGELDLDPATLDARAEVTLLLEQGDVVAWRTDLVAVLRALRDVGVELTDDLAALVETGAEVPVATGFSDLGNGASIERPARSEVCETG